MSLLSAIAAMIFVVMFPVLLASRRTGIPGIASFCAACLLGAFSSLAGLASGIAPLWLGTLSGAILAVAAALMTLNGFRQFLRRRPLAPWSVVATLAGSAIVLVFFGSVIVSPAAAAIAEAGLVGAIHLLIAATIIRHWRREHAIAPYMLFSCLAALALGLLSGLQAIVLVAGLGSPMTAEPQIFTSALLAARILTAPLFLLGIILMLHGRMIANLHHIIAHDDLTGALSRPAFLARGEACLAAAAKTGQLTAFMMLDLDRFKQINERHGHAGGDAALALFAAAVRKTLAGRGILGRLGGEEFGIVLAGTSRLDAAEMAEAICAAVRANSAAATSGIALTVSIGVAIAEPGATLPEIMARADMALYEAKAMGRDRPSIAGSLHPACAASSRALAGVAAQMRASAGAQDAAAAFSSVA